MMSETDSESVVETMDALDAAAADAGSVIDFVMTGLGYTKTEDGRVAVECYLVIHRWPVLQRETNDDGTLKSGKGAYVRTKEPMETRGVKVLAFITRTRVEIAFNTVTTVVFSVNTGRGVNMPDWVIEKNSLRHLRKLRQQIFKAPPKKKDVAEGDPASDASQEGAESHAPEG